MIGTPLPPSSVISVVSFVLLLSLFSFRVTTTQLPSLLLDVVCSELSSAVAKDVVEASDVVDDVIMLLRFFRGAATGPEPDEGGAGAVFLGDDVIDDCGRCDPVTFWPCVWPWPWAAAVTSPFPISPFGISRVFGVGDFDESATGSEGGGGGAVLRNDRGLWLINGGLAAWCWGGGESGTSSSSLRRSFWAASWTSCASTRKAG